ncbi:MAG TPA: hypothetical protein VL522_22245 [Bordetella sp.]|nr:hypothetical protein [Bordetella sp.]
MYSPDREALARQRLRLMQQSGLATRITESQMARRQANQATGVARRELRNNEVVGDLQVLRQMMLLIQGAEQIRSTPNGTAQPRDYAASKKLVATVVDTSPVGQIGRHHDWSGSLLTAGQVAGAAVPAAINAAAATVANMTGIQQIETAAAIAVRGTEILDAALGVANIASIPVPGDLSVATGSNAGLIEACLEWWMSPAAATAVSTYVPFLSLLSSLSAGITVCGHHKKIDPLLALDERYRGACTCNESVAGIAEDWQSAAFGTAAGLNPATGLALVAHDTYDKVQHYARKKLAGNDMVHRDSYYTAKKLWEAAQDSVTPAHRTSRLFFTSVNTQGRCPLAMLTLATLFGKGHPESGVVKAAAAIVAEPISAANRIKKLVAG